MSKIDELINNLCPDGVEHKTLGQICKVITKGTTPTTFGYQYENGGVNFIKVESIDDNGNFISEKFAHISNDCHNKLSRSILEKDDILFSIAGAIGKLAIIKEDILPANTNQALAILRLDKSRVFSRYVFYILQTGTASEQYLVKKSGAAQPNVSLNSLSSIKIPVPPLEVQREIVRILDKFTELQLCLQNELTARKKQYEYYRDELLNVEDRINDAEWKELGEFAIVTKLAGFEFTKYIKYIDSGKIIALRGLNVKNGKLDLSEVKYIDGSDLSKLTRSKLCVGDMLFTYVGTVGQVALIDEDEKYYLAPNVALVRIKNKSYVLPEYLRYYFQTTKFKQFQLDKLLQASSMQNIPMNKIRNFVIPVPPLEEQERIVAILDRFDKLCNDLTQGLPAEIEARKKQYEYYRDKLLAFPALSPRV